MFKIALPDPAGGAYDAPSDSLVGSSFFTFNMSHYLKSLKICPGRSTTAENIYLCPSPKSGWHQKVMVMLVKRLMMMTKCFCNNRPTAEKEEVTRRTKRRSRKRE